MAQNTIFAYLKDLREKFGSDIVWRTFINEKLAQYIDCIESGHTNPQIADHWNITTQRVKQIELKAETRLKQILDMSDALRDLIMSEDLDEIKQYISRKQKQAEDDQRSRLKSILQLNQRKMEIANEVAIDGLIG
jgi:N-methylhydantoinase B/oxoprolinase/acetone carboxylase alpha subunit